MINGKIREADNVLRRKEENCRIRFGAPEWLG